VPLIIRDIGADAVLNEHLALDALATHLTPALLEQVVRTSHVREKRLRKLPAPVVLALCVAMNLFAHDALRAVFRRMVHGLRWLWVDPAQLQVSKGAISQARDRLGARPVVALFHHVCRPLATSQTPGAYTFGYRHLALDTQVLDLPDTPENAQAFGRPSTDRGTAAWPQARLVGLIECGTHAYLDAGLWPYGADQHAAARRLLRRVGRGNLLSYDCGLHSYAMLAAARARGAHVLARLPAGVRPTILRVLADGSLLARIAPSTGPQRAHRGILVRLIRYTLDDPVLPHCGEEHRLITTLLNPRRAPAEAVVCAYHPRWEYELAADELETHQRPRTPLRSHKPIGVLQEVYGLLIAHYLVRAVMAQAAQTADLPPTRLSFLETLRILRDYLPDFQRTDPRDHPHLRAALLADVLAAKLPPRVHRINPRVVKQKMTSFPVKRAHHRHWPKPTKPFREAIVLLN
jgi:hypothetical protein